ncbi:hypothetical protein DNTS_009868 [Danionella cerebrum]|uniref:BRCT domain-containing protein n=1 Tax=Danionella cerebrum TaxID=2873325 RepID=A0A553NJN7_9TELE|nr:hypothetical protein DNTS_009868 [Danionella translucida]
MLPRRKRKCPEVSLARRDEKVQFRDVRVYLVERRMGRSRRTFLSNLAWSKGFCVDDTLSAAVTHVVSEGVSAQDLWIWLEEQGFKNHSSNVLDISWFIQSMSSSLAFLRVASVLKSLPAALKSVEETHCLPGLGEHSRTVIQLFCSVFGVGVRTAENWFYQGLRSLEQVLAEPGVRLNRRQTAGLLFHEDLRVPVSRREATDLQMLLEDAAFSINPSITITLAGGFRRGKEFGHDVDFIVKTPEPGQEKMILPALIERLKLQGILLYSECQESTFDPQQLPAPRFQAMDQFSKCFLILKLGVQGPEMSVRDWRGVRVDLVAPPLDRMAFALLGWTGSTMFERDLRRFARLERGKLLDNHALYVKATVGN